MHYQEKGIDDEIKVDKSQKTNNQQSQQKRLRYYQYVMMPNASKCWHYK